MYNQIIMGKPKKCINRNCHARFFKESIVGYLPDTNSTVLCVVRCPECNDQFAIVQMVSIVKEYMNELPCKPKIKKDDTVITMTEIEDMRKKLNQENLLRSLNEGTEGKHF